MHQLSSSFDEPAETDQHARDSLGTSLILTLPETSVLFDAVLVPSPGNVLSLWA
jgi:hypothetical protein